MSVSFSVQKRPKAKRLLIFIALCWDVDYRSRDGFGMNLVTTTMQTASSVFNRIWRILLNRWRNAFIARQLDTNQSLLLKFHFGNLDLDSITHTHTYIMILHKHFMISFWPNSSLWSCTCICSLFYWLPQ